MVFIHKALEPKQHAARRRWKQIHVALDDEFHPGKDDPVRTVYYTAAKEIRRGGSVLFEYDPSPPLPVRRDGSFLISIKVAGLERVYY